MRQVIENKWFLKKTLDNLEKIEVRIFLFPPAGGDVSTYFSWEEHFPMYTETCFLKLPGRGKRIREPLVSDFNTIIDNVINEMESMPDIPFLFFGHSMGALIAYETAVKCYQMKLRLPKKLIVSGMKAPDILSDMNQKPGDIKLYELENEKLRSAILDLGGMPDILKQNERFLDVLLPIFRSDLKLCETYRIENKEKLPIDIDILGGDNDTLSSLDQLEAWKEYSLNKVKSTYFKGGHFYFYDNLDMLLKIISESINDVKEKYKKGCY